VALSPTYAAQGAKLKLVLLAWRGPSNWLVKQVGVEDRRAFGFWTIIFAIVGSIWWNSFVWWVVVLSILALIPNYAAETPVEQEKSE
jgi:hypothetical protein